MKKILRDISTKRIISIVDFVREESNGLYTAKLDDQGNHLNACIYPYNLEPAWELVLAENVPDEVEPNKYLFNGGMFELNPNYVPYESDFDKIIRLEKERDEANVKGKLMFDKLRENGVV